MIARNQKSDILTQSPGRTVLQRVADDFRMALTMAMQDLQRSLNELERKEESPQGTPPLSCQIPAGFPNVFRMLGLDGLPRGDLLEIIGTEGSGRAVFVMSLIRHSQQEGATVAWIDPESAFPSRLLSLHGLDARRTVMLRASHPETLAASLERLLTSGGVDAVVFAPNVLTDSRYATPLASLNTSNDRSAAISPLLDCARRTGTALVSLSTRPDGSQRGGRGGRFRLGMQPITDTFTIVKAERGFGTGRKTVGLSIKERGVVETTDFPRNFG